MVHIDFILGDSRSRRSAIFLNGLYAAGRWPVGIYPSWLRTVFTVLVPVAFAVTIPAEALTIGLTGREPAFCVWHDSCLHRPCARTLALGLSNYSGASS